MNRNLSNCENSLKKRFFGASTGFEPVASALALQCSPSWAMKTHTLEAGQLLSSSTRERNETLNEMMWTAGIQINCLNCNCLNCDSLRWSHTRFIYIPAVHIISFSVSFLSRVDELNKLASLQCMGSVPSALNPNQFTHAGDYKSRLNCRKNRKRRFQNKGNLNSGYNENKF